MAITAGSPFYFLPSPALGRRPPGVEGKGLGFRKKFGAQVMLSVFPSIPQSAIYNPDLAHSAFRNPQSAFLPPSPFPLPSFVS